MMNPLELYFFEGKNKAARQFESRVGTKKSLRVEDLREEVRPSLAAREKEGLRF